MRKYLLLLPAIFFISCNQVPSGDLSGILDAQSKEVQMTKELMQKYSEGKFREIVV